MECGVVFKVGERLFALPLEVVGRVVRAVDVTPVADGPSMVDGVIDVEGEFMPVIDVGHRFGLPKRELELSEQFLLARTARRAVALRVERVEGVVGWQAQDFVSAAELMEAAPFLKGVARDRQGMILVQDLDAFLGIDREQASSRASSHG